MKKMGALMEKWGYMLLAVLCAGVIVFSALWTKQTETEPPPGVQALSDESQRLQEVTPCPADQPGFFWTEETVRGFSAAPVFFPQTRIWQPHAGVDFLCPEGHAAKTLRGGRVRLEKDAVFVERGDESERYRGLSEITVRAGQDIAAGEQIGLGGGHVPFEGRGHLCVTFFRKGVPFDFFGEQEP